MKILRNLLVVLAASHTLAGRRVAERMQRIGLGIGLLLISGVLGLLGIIGGLCSMFFALADVSRFIYPSLIAGGISFLLAILIGIEGRKFLRP